MKKLIMLLMFSIILFSVVSAWSLNPFADTKYQETNKEAITNSFLKDTFNDKYGVVQISNTFFWIETDKVAEYSLVDNTEQCSIDCSAEGRATLYSDGGLFEGVDFIGIEGKSELSNVQYWIKINETYTADVPETYKDLCKEGEKDYCIKIPDTYVKKELQREVWKEYNFESLKAGNYEWKLTGQKEFSQNVDFQIKTKGQVLNQWAWWNGTGGVMTYDGAYTVVTFTSSGVFKWEGANNNVSVLVVGGGAGAGQNDTQWAYVGGGGAGGLLTNTTYFVSAQDYIVYVGAGGNKGQNGTNSTFGTLIATGGGTGSTTLTASKGGSGGGGSANVLAGGIAVAGQGNNGGSGTSGGGWNTGGGGGGAGAIGGDGIQNTRGGMGGDGVANSITGTSIYYAGGGASGKQDGCTGLELGGNGGGGNCSATTTSNGLANTGSGGGAGGSVANSKGGSGVVIIRYLTALADSAPVIILNSPDDASTFNINSISFNCTSYDEILVQNLTLYINNSINQTNTTVYNNTPAIFSTSLPEGYYTWKCGACDNIGQCANATERTLTIDTTPFIEFLTPPTLPNNTNITQEYIPMKVNVSTLYFQNISFDLYNINGTMYTQFYTNETYDINFTDMPDAHYHYNVTICTTTNKCNTTETRHLNHDTVPPTIYVISGNGTISYQNFSENYTLVYNISHIADPFDLGNCTLEYNYTNRTIPCTSGEINSTNFTLQLGINNATIYANDTIGNLAERFVEWTFSYLFINETHNLTSFETKYENYILNLGASSLPTNAFLSYNGTNYSATITDLGGGFYTISKLNFSPPSGDNLFFYKFKVNGTDFNSSLYSQNVTPLIFINCNATYDTKFINFTFKDETTLVDINATIPTSTFYYWIDDSLSNKTLTYINNSENYSFGFCTNAVNDTLHIQPRIQYVSTGYPQRVYQFSDLSLTNVTKNQTLYLLATADGLFVTFQVINSAQQHVSGVDVEATRSIGGIPVTVGQGVTGDDGSVTFWLNPDFVHTLTFTKSGYESFTLSLTPTQSLYTVTLGFTPTTPLNDYLKGIDFTIRPFTGITLQPNSTINFNFTLNSTYWEVTSFGFNLEGQNGTILGSNSSNLNSGIVVLSVNTSNYTDITMNYFWIINGTYTNGSTSWMIYNDTIGNGWSLKNFFTDTSRYSSEGMFGLNQDSLNLIIFILIFSIVGIASYKFGIQSEGIISGMVFALVFIFDVGLGMINIGIGINYFPTILFGLIMVGFIVYGSTR